jgi:hypothetical protein
VIGAVGRKGLVASDLKGDLAASVAGVTVMCLPVAGEERPTMVSQSSRQLGQGKRQIDE